MKNTFISTGAIALFLLLNQADVNAKFIDNHKTKHIPKHR